MGSYNYPRASIEAAEFAYEDVRLEEERGRNTIFEDIQPASTLLRSSSFLSFNTSNRDRDPSPGPSFHRTMLDMLLAAVRAFFDQLGLVTWFLGAVAPYLEPDEIDRLALFQGVYLNLFLQGSDESRPDENKIRLYKELLQNENHFEWEHRCRRLLGGVTYHSPLIKEQESFRAKLRAYLGSWSQAKDHCSPNIFLLDDKLTAHRIPCVNQTDSIRGKVGFKQGVHAWSMRILGPPGTHCSVGVATKDAKLWTHKGYVSLIGGDEFSWGWDIRWGNVSHQGKVLAKYPKDVIYEYKSGDAVTIILDCDKGNLAFAVNEKYFGVAFDNLPKKTLLYPSIGMVYGNIEASLVYLGPHPSLRNSK